MKARLTLLTIGLVTIGLAAASGPAAAHHFCLPPIDRDDPAQAPDPARVLGYVQCETRHPVEDAQRLIDRVLP